MMRLFFFAATQLALQLQQGRTYVVCSNKCLSRRHSRNGPWTHEFRFEVMYLYVDSGLRNRNGYD